MRSLLSLGRALRAVSRSIDGGRIASRLGSTVPGGAFRHVLPVVLSLIACTAGGGALLAPGASAEAVPGPGSTAGPSGLPDGRVYEQVSPPNKPGSEAGGPIGEVPPYIAGGAAGDEVAYFKSGPLGDTSLGLDFFSISHRLATGWTTRGALSAPEGSAQFGAANPSNGLGFSADMKASVFGATSVFVPEQDQADPTPHLYRYDENGLVQWIGKPTILDPLKFEGFLGEAGAGGIVYGELMGASSDYDTIFFGFEGTLTPADEEQNPTLGGISRAEEIGTMNKSGKPPTSNDGVYEWHDGELRNAGVLPDGHLDPYGARPISFVNSNESPKLERFRNQVSEDAHEAFFMSPDPESESGRPSELYESVTRPDGTHTTVLVSRDPLLPEVGGLPAPAPGGADGSRHFFASPDGSRAFFQSAEQLTAAAPNDGKLKEYEFDTATQAMTYLPGVADVSAGSSAVLSEIVRSSRDGSSFIFIREGELELWKGGAITTIAPVSSKIVFMRATASGSTYFFQTSSPFPAFGFNNGNGSYQQIYRYEVAENTLSCLSCPPTGTNPSGNATLSHAYESADLGSTDLIITGSHAISSDGLRVVFDTPDPLVSQDANGVRDAYEWEDGVIHLISTGVSQENSFSGDTSGSGDDVFFSTGEGLVPGDKDEGYDVYDARVPRPGDRPPPSAVPCEGAVCQGPPSAPQLLSPPASVAFDGPGDATPVSLSHSGRKSLTRQQRLARALKACKRSKNASRRARCRRQARHRYGGKASGARVHATQGNGNRQGNRGGK
jgi:hypothetical protein